MILAHHTNRQRRRIIADFLEMPDLSVSATQGHYLWDIEEETCREILEALVAAKFLRQTPRGRYLRARNMT